MYAIPNIYHIENAYRIYINTPSKSDETDTFLTDYMKMCISKKIPYTMKGYQEKGEEAKDKTVLYLNEENLQDYLQILDELSVLHPDTIKHFGEPPLLTQTLSSKEPNLKEGWFGFADLGNDNTVTYNDRTQQSCVNAIIATIYSQLPYKSKVKLQENGYSVKALSNMSKFEIEYEQVKGTKVAKRKAIFPKMEEVNGVKSPIYKDGTLKTGKDSESFLSELISLCNKEISEIISNPERKNKMFESFKSYYVLMENYRKFNSQHNKHSMQYTFEDYRNLPTTISMSLYQKYQQELLNGENQQQKEDGKEKSFSEVFQEAFRKDKMLKSGVDATIGTTRVEQMNQQTNLIKEQFIGKEKQQTQVEQ